MTNQKKISPEDDLLDKEFIETISQLNAGLDKLDSMNTYNPGEQWFEQMVLSQQEQMKRKFRRELGWFIISALFIISGLIFTLLEIPQLFLFLQLVAIGVTVIYSFKGVQKQVDDR